MVQRTPRCILEELSRSYFPQGGAHVRICVYVLFYVSTKEGEKYLAFDIESQYSGVSATVKLSRNCVRVFYDLLRDIGSWPRYVHCAENYASEPRLLCDVRLSCSFRATRNIRIIYKIIFDNFCIFSFSE